jgi:hypothetical protein
MSYGMKELPFSCRRREGVSLVAGPNTCLGFRIDDQSVREIHSANGATPWKVIHARVNLFDVRPARVRSQRNHSSVHSDSCAF